MSPTDIVDHIPNGHREDLQESRSAEVYKTLHNENKPSCNDGEGQKDYHETFKAFVLYFFEELAEPKADSFHRWLNNDS